MSRRIRSAGIALALLAVVMVAGVVAIAITRAHRASSAPTCAVVSTRYALDPDQAANAAEISAVAIRRGLPQRAVVIALATAYQESKLVNIPADAGDLDSVGLFQQRPSQGWGAPADLSRPAYAAGKFYDALVKVRAWQTDALTVVAQKVQRSAYPQAYARWEPLATGLAGAFVGSQPAGLACRYDSGPRADPEAVAASVQRDFPVAAPVAATPAVHRPPALDVAASTSSGGWAIAAWIIAHGSTLHVESVGYAGKVWHRGDLSWSADRTQTGTGVHVELSGGTSS